MPRTTKTITFSLPPGIAERLDEVMQQQGRSRSEFLREAVLRYIEECEWRQLLQYGEARSRALGIGPEDVPVYSQRDGGDRRHLLPIGEHQGIRIVNAPRFLSELDG